MSLLQLAPDIQEAILFLPLTVEGRDAVGERLVFHFNRRDVFPREP